MRMRTRAAVAAMVAAGIVLGSNVAASADDAPAEAGIFVKKVDGLPADFALGVDVSSVLSEEESGVAYRDAAGNPADIFGILAASGVNTVRIRVWNDPYDADGHGYGGGDVDVARAVQIGERATAAGLGVLVDFHYSDFWADPGRQLAPKAWAAYSNTQKAAAIHDFTADALHSFVAAGVDVRMVQIGNETNNGIAGYARAGTPIDQTFASLIQAGSSAVRETLPNALVAVHFTNPETPGRYATYAAGLAEYGVDYDVFASSYYPYWHGTTANLTAVLSDIAQTYGKKVMVAETSWVRTFDDGDGFADSIGTSADTSAYPVSVQGQADELRDVIAAVHAVGDAGIGVFSWEPAWIPVGPASALAANRALWEKFGSGWAASFAASYDPVNVGTYYGGSSWDNQSLFAWDGTPLESLKTFAYVRTGAVAPRVVTGVAPVELTVQDGDAVTLPQTLTVSYNDETTEHPAVTWSTALDWIRGPGEYSIPGTAAGGISVTAKVTVLAHSYVVDGGFEQGSSAWTLTGPAARTQTSDAPEGSYAVTFWSGTAYSATAAQHLSGVPAGSYVLQATTQGTNSPDSDARTLAATTSAGTATTALQFTGWNQFHTATVPVTVGSDGVVDIAASFALTGGAWGVLDDVRLVAAPGGIRPDTTQLDGELARAAEVDRSLWSAESLRTLDEAVAIGKVVDAGSRITAADVKEAAKLVKKAVTTLHKAK